MLTCELRYVLGDWIGWANQHAKKFVAQWSGGNDPEEAKILMTIGDLNLQQGTSVQRPEMICLPLLLSSPSQTHS